MSEWVRGFVIRGVADVHAEFRKCIRDAERLISLERQAKRDFGGAKLLADLEGSYEAFNVNLKFAAREAAARAQKGMVERLEATRKRSETGSVPPMKDLVSARPLEAINGMQTGAVGVGDVQLLNRAVNSHSRGYGTYWRALEYGTGQGRVPSQIGRVIYGSFTGPGGSNPMAPDSQYAGGGGPHPVFIGRQSGSVSSIAGQRVVGLGTINKEIEPKRFIKFGADDAEIAWRDAIAQTQQRALNELRAIRLSGS